MKQILFFFKFHEMILNIKYQKTTDFLLKKSVEQL